MKKDTNKGRNLSILSFAIIVFVLANGSLVEGNNFSLFGGSFDLKNIHVVRAAILSVFIFYWYRHYLNFPFISLLNKNFNNYLREYSPFKKYILSESQQQVHGDNGIIENYGFNADELGSGTFVRTDITPPERDFDDHFRWYRSNIPISVRYFTNGTETSCAEASVTINWLWHKYYLLISIWLYARSDNFLDQMLPHLLAVAASICLIYKAFHIYI